MKVLIIITCIILMVTGLSLLGTDTSKKGDKNYYEDVQGPIPLYQTNNLIGCILLLLCLIITIIGAFTYN